ncbi:E3 ubiquitin-protein ligase RNF14-like [Oryza brachyantha]|uniref:E3 ubiquitin-protein ligase RNF14-like n=1 Tax=Oryza brachyantha TaxID=4533 RepID=UPI0007764336|nr:E3 ubiquitin-protein ligase RNF14-like [Oryza brachyantha]
MMALEAIYGDDLALFGKKGGLHYFEIYIHYNLNEGTEVCAKLSSANSNPKDGRCSDGIEEHGDEPDEFSYSCNFEYLPPLVLTCLLPLTYPSKDPPYFTITVKWMDGPNVSQLCEMLDTLWAELPGQEVVYQWVEWLRNSSRSYLWFDGKITLGPDIPMHKVDCRAISRSLSLESVIPSMLSYSSKKLYQAFLEDLHMCMICLNQSKGSNFIRLPCQHLFCVKCLGTLCRMHVKEGSVFQLVCPDTKCNASIPPYVLKRLLMEDEFERWDRLRWSQKALDSMSDVVYCPRCVIGCLEDEDNNAQCPKCSFFFCSFCKEPCHPSKQCLTPEEKLQRRQASGRMSEREMAQEMLSIKALYSDVRLCPKCRMAISKTEGCNKMVCGNCGQFFCFRCGKAIKGYDHFSECQLFAPRDISAWERQMEEQFGNHVRTSLRPVGGTVRCPKCRERNFKDDEKYIFCWACRANYCTLCRREVQDKRGHFGSPECVGLEDF